MMGCCEGSDRMCWVGATLYFDCVCLSYGLKIITHHGFDGIFMLH